LGIVTLGMPGSPAEILAAILLMIVIAIALTGLGFFLAWRMDSTQGFHAIMSVLLLPMWLLAGTVFPPNPSSWITWLSQINPLTYGVAGLRHYLHFGDTSMVNVLPSLPVCWAVSLGFAVVTVALSWWIAGTRTTGDLL
jgi:ABC-2 type transport system permease protein